MSDDAHHKLAKSIADLDKKVDRRFRSVSTSISKLERKVMDDIKPLLDDLTGRKYVAANRLQDNGQLMGQVLKITVILAGIIATLLKIGDI